MCLVDNACYSNLWFSLKTPIDFVFTIHCEEFDNSFEVNKLIKQFMNGNFLNSVYFKKLIRL